MSGWRLYVFAFGCTLLGVALMLGAGFMRLLAASAWGFVLSWVTWLLGVAIYMTPTVYLTRRRSRLSS